MRVVVQIHNDAVDGMLRWRETLGRDAHEQLQMYRVQMDSMREEFEKHRGFPPLAHRDTRRPATVFWWQFSDTLRVEFFVIEKPSRPRGWWDITRFFGRLLWPTTRVVVLAAAQWTPRPA